MVDSSALPLNRIGKTALYVTGLGLGTAQLGNLYKSMSDAEAVAIVQTALSKNITLLDTAPYYGQGLSEKRLGLALAGVPRTSYVLSTKVGRLVTPNAETVFDFSRDGIFRSLEASLIRLKVDYVDIVHLHDPDNCFQEALQEAFPALADLRQQGVIKAISAGMNQWEMLLDFAKNAEFDCFMLAGRYTLLEQEALQEFLPICEAKNISILAAGIYNSGILAKGAQSGAKYNYQAASPEILEQVRRLEQICERYNIPLKLAAMQFPKSHPAVASLIVGADHWQEVLENLQLYSEKVPKTFWDSLKQAGLVKFDTPLD